MAIKSYNSKADYDAAVKPTTESQVSMIETTREIIVDGVNVVTTQPTVGDVVFLDDQNKVIYVKGGAWIQKANIPAAWTHVGYVYFRKGKQVGIIHTQTLILVAQLVDLLIGHGVTGSGCNKQDQNFHIHHIVDESQSLHKLHLLILLYKTCEKNQAQPVTLRHILA